LVAASKCSSISSAVTAGMPPSFGSSRCGYRSSGDDRRASTDARTRDHITAEGSTPASVFRCCDSCQNDAPERQPRRGGEPPRTIIYERQSLACSPRRAVVPRGEPSRCRVHVARNCWRRAEVATGHCRRRPPHHPAQPESDTVASTCDQRRDQLGDRFPKSPR
jgi:hypothetical protein